MPEPPVAAPDHAAVIRLARGMAHRAVTEGVNLKYVEQLRQETYKLADLADALLAERQQDKQRIERLVGLYHAFNAAVAGLAAGEGDTAP